MNLFFSNAIYKRGTNLICYPRFCKTPFLKLVLIIFIKKEKLFAFSVSILWSVPKGGQTSYISSTCIWTHPITDITYRPGQNTHYHCSYYCLWIATAILPVQSDSWQNNFGLKFSSLCIVNWQNLKYKLEQPELCREIWGLSVSCAEDFGGTGLSSSEREDSQRFRDVIVAPRRFLQM